MTLHITFPNGKSETVDASQWSESARAAVVLTYEASDGYSVTTS